MTQITDFVEAPSSQTTTSEPADGGVDLDGMRHAAVEDEGHGHHLQARYLRSGAAEIERLRARVKDLDRAD